MQIKKVLLALSTMLTYCIILESKQTFSIMLDPASDAKPGRNIDNAFERGITLQYVENLKTMLEQTYDNISVYITRLPGEIVYPLQNANFANRLHVNLYISIHFYHEKNILPKVFLYRFSYNDDFITPKKLTFYRYDQAHFSQNKTTKKIAELIKTTLTQEKYIKLFTIQGVYSLPFKPLIGITAPAIGIEIGITKEKDCKIYIDPLTQAIGKIIKRSKK